MLEELLKIREEALKRLEQVESEADLSELNVSFLGRNGALTSILRTMSKLAPEDRAKLGKEANEVKQYLTGMFDQVRAGIEKKAEERRIKAETVDVTLPGVVDVPMGRLSPLTVVYR